MSCAAARSAPSSAYLLALAQPAMSTPMTESARHRQRVEDADVEVGDDEASGPAGITTNTRNVEITTIAGREREDAAVGLAPA